MTTLRFDNFFFPRDIFLFVTLKSNKSCSLSFLAPLFMF